MDGVLAPFLVVPMTSAWNNAAAVALMAIGAVVTVLVMTLGLSWVWVVLPGLALLGLGVTIAWRSDAQGVSRGE